MEDKVKPVNEDESRENVLNTISEIQEILQQEKEKLLSGEISPKLSLMLCIDDDTRYIERGFASSAIMFQFITSMVSEYPQLKDALINLWNDLTPQQQPVMPINPELN